MSIIIHIYLLLFIAEVEPKMKDNFKSEGKSKTDEIIWSTSYSRKYLIVISIQTLGLQLFVVTPVVTLRILIPLGSQRPFASQLAGV